MRRQGRFFANKLSGDRRTGNDPDYEEVGPVTMNLKHTPDGRGDGKHCEVCGSAQAAVRCESCSGQVFCPACDDVFHKHPRRTAHVRKTMEGVRPPLPPKGTEGGQMVPPPQPPPRKNKRGFLGGGGFARKDQLSGSMVSLRHDPREKPSLIKSNSAEGSGEAHTVSGAGRTIMGSLKRFMGSRPLPPPPGGADGKGAGNSPGSAVHSNLIRSITSPNLANDGMDTSLAVAIPQTVVDLSNNSNNNMMGRNKYPAPAPPGSSTPPYPALLPRPLAGGGGPPQPGPPTAPIHAHQRKLSLQPTPVGRDQKRQSMIDGGSWDAPNRLRSQSVSDEQWSQLLAAQGHAAPPPPPHHQPNEPMATARERFNTVGGATGRSGAPGRGMMSSTSVCNLNTLSQPQQQPLQQPQQQQHQLMPHMAGMHPSGSFQQLNMVPYNGGIMWSPPCDMCHAPPPMYPPPLPSHGMKRAASNLSMNMSSASSDVTTGYPWPPHMHQQPPHMHHPMYPGYYPPPPPPPAPHIMQNSMQGSSISIPDSMAAFSKISCSPAPSVRSSSRRSHKSNKSRSFSTADLSRRTRSTHRSDTDDSTSSSPSIEDDIHSSKPGYPGGPLAWQCDHCTFINQAGSRVCGMCSKTQGSSSSHSRTNRRNSDTRRRERRYIGRRNGHDDDDREPSDYENDGKHSTLQYNNRDNRRDKSSRSSISSKNKKKLRRRGGSSGSASDVVDDLERQLSDMKLAKSRGPECDGLSSKIKEREKDRDRERGSRRREGKPQRRD